MDYNYDEYKLFRYLNRYLVLAEIGKHNQQSWNYFI